MVSFIIIFVNSNALEFTFFYTPMLLPIMGFISKFILYFLLVLVSLRFLQYLKHKTNYEKELVELIKKSNHLTNKEK